MIERAEVQRPAPLREQIIAAIFRLLGSGAYPPGARLTELGLARRLRVSRTPVREALGRLVQRGVLELRDAGGYRVPMHSVAEVRDVIAVRRLVEPPALRLAARDVDAAHLAALDAAIRCEAAAAAACDPQAFADAHAAFRRAIFAPLTNRALREVIARFDAQFEYFRAITEVSEPACRALLARQVEVRDALVARQPEIAEVLWTYYLQHTEEWLVRILGAWATPTEAASTRRRPRARRRSRQSAAAAAGGTRSQ